MFLVALVLVSALAVPLAGGRLGALVELPLRHVWAIYAALGLAVLGVGVPGLPDGLRSLLLVAAYPVGAVFLAANRRIPGMALIALGAVFNLLAITVNAGVMPASPAALAAAGLPVDEPGFQSSTAVADPRLAFLGDVFAIPASWPLSNVFSVGDVLIGVGLAWGVHRICGSRLVPRRFRREPKRGRTTGDARAMAAPAPPSGAIATSTGSTPWIRCCRSAKRPRPSSSKRWPATSWERPSSSGRTSVGAN